MTYPNSKSNYISKSNRRSIRLPGYDYSEAGAYFVTICIHNRLCLFGNISDGKMALTDSGLMAQTTWYELPKFYPGVQVDAFQIMPNHLHGIIILQGINYQSSVGAGPRACPNMAGQPQGVAPTRNQMNVGAGPCARPDQGIKGQEQKTGQARRPAPTKILSLPDVVHHFKTMTTKRYIDGVKQWGWAPFPGKLWQRNYYEHIIRNEKEMNEIREYIANNPKQWDLDQENPNAQIMGNHRGLPLREIK
jgi:putative transposase